MSSLHSRRCYLHQPTDERNENYLNSVISKHQETVGFITRDVFPEDQGGTSSQLLQMSQVAKERSRAGRKFIPGKTLKRHHPVI